MRKGAVLIFLQAAAMLIAGCALGVGEDYRTAADAKAVEAAEVPAGAVIAEYNLRVYVPVPAAGEAPVKSVTTRADMDITAEWKDGEGTDITESLEVFEEGGRYQAAITLAAKNGYAFDRAIPFAYREGVVENQSAADNSDPGMRTVLAVYRAAERLVPAGRTDLTEYIPKPVGGAVPVMNFPAVEYAGHIQWEQGGGGSWAAMGDSVFRAGMAYRAVVLLEAASGYTFKGSPGFKHTLSVSGGGDLPLGENTGGTAGLRIEFGETPPNYIRNYDLNYYVPLPVEGQLPQRVLNPPGMTVTASWYEKARSGGWEPFASGVFRSEGRYRAEITLAAGTGYAFERDFAYAAGLVGAQEQSAENGAYRRVVTVTYAPFMPRAEGEGGEGIGFTGSALAQIREHAGGDALYVSLALHPDGEPVGAGAAYFSPGSSPRSLIIDGNGGTLKLDGLGNGSLLRVESGITVTLRDITLEGLEGLEGYEGNTKSLVEVSGGTLILENAHIKGNRNSLNGGGGVYISGGGFFTMNGGSVSGNTATNGGGVYIVTSGSFRMNSGTITSNTADKGGGVYRQLYTDDGGINDDSKDCVLYGGTITSNTAAEGDGIYFGGWLTMNAGIVVDSDNLVYLMEGARIIIESPLHANPVANISSKNSTNVSHSAKGWALMGQIAGNYSKFLVDGMSGKIDIYGKYIP
jgi:hypothetical protein